MPRTRYIVDKLFGIRSFWLQVSASLAVALSLTSCSPSVSTPHIIVDFIRTPDEIQLTDWRVVGPFNFTLGNIPEVRVGTRDGALEHDFLRDFGPDEVNTDANSLEAIKKNLINIHHLPSDFINRTIHFDHVTIRLDKLFQTNVNAVAYAACELESAEEKEITFLAGADDAVKVWLNNDLLLNVPVEVNSGEVRYATLGQNAYYRAGRLKKGKNFLLVKVYQINRMWGFNCSVSTLEYARKKAADRELYLDDVLAKSVLTKGELLTLHTDISNLIFNLKLSGRVELLNFVRHTISTEQLDFRDQWSKSLGELQPGLYYCRFACPLFSLEEPFYYGEAGSLLPSLQRRYRELGIQNEKIELDFDALSSRYGYLFGAENLKPQNKLWQRKIVYLINEIESLFARLKSGRQATKNYPGTHLRGFRSEIDGQVQHYMIHLPSKYAKSKERAPLVIILPYPVARPRPFLESVHVANIDLIATYVKLADRYGYALLWPAARGNSEGAPIAMADIFEVINAAKKDYDLDEDRTYLFGWSLGGTYSLLMAERFPGLFAAIGAVEPPTDLVAQANFYGPLASNVPASWLNLNNPLALAGNLNHTPIYLVHGDEDTTVPTQQSLRFIETCQQHGFNPRLDILTGMDHEYSPDDPNPHIFAFFKDKIREKRPHIVSFSTAQLKYDTAYWVKVGQLIDPTKLGGITAVVTLENRIEVTTVNIERYEILLKELDYDRKRDLIVVNNGQASFNGIPASATIPINVLPTISSPGVAVYKNHQIEGPIMHAFADQFLVVEGSGGSATDVEEMSLYGRAIRDSWRQDYFVDCESKKDWEVNQEDIRKKHLVLIGNAETNSLIKQVINATPLRITIDHISLSERQYDGKSLGVEMIYPNPLNHEKYIVIIGANNCASLKLYESHLSLRGWYDFVIWTSDVRQQTRVIDVGYWDPSWQHSISSIGTNSQ